MRLLIANIIATVICFEAFAGSMPGAADYPVLTESLVEFESRVSGFERDYARCDKGVSPGVESSCRNGTTITRTDGV